MYSIQGITATIAATGLVWSKGGVNWNSSVATNLPESSLTSGVQSPTQQIFEILVGAQGKLAFNSESVTVLPGTVLRFNFLSRNHTLTQSSFQHPCINGSSFDTGFNQFNPRNISGELTVDYHVNSNLPQWFFCAQTLPRSHCAAGMVFSLNPKNNPRVFKSNAVTPLSGINITTATALSYCNRIESTQSKTSMNVTVNAPSRTVHGSENTSTVLQISNEGHRTRTWTSLRLVVTTALLWLISF